MSDTDTCPCLEAPTSDYHRVRNIGVDETNGRFGEVELWQCKHCSRYWLRYFVEYEAFTGSGRHFWGLITLEQAQAMTPHRAVSFIESLDWHLYGGSYFYGKTGRTLNYPGHHLPVDE